MKLFDKFIRKSHELEYYLYLHDYLHKSNLNLPDFLGIGVQKAGTTWLSENLRCHPEIYMAKEKELQFFSPKFDKSLNYYSNKFKNGGAKTKGEVSPNYCVLREDIIQSIHSLLPDVKIILLLRNPIERSWSGTVMKLVREPGLKLEDVDEQDFINYFNNIYILRQSTYSNIIKTWYKYFEKNQIYIGLFDHIKSQPKEFLIDIFSFLKVSTDINWNNFPHEKVIIPPVGPKYSHHPEGRGVVINEKYENTGKNMPIKFRSYLSEMFEKEIELLYKKYDLPVSHWL